MLVFDIMSNIELPTYHNSALRYAEYIIRNYFIFVREYSEAATDNIFSFTSKDYNRLYDPNKISDITAQTAINLVRDKNLANTKQMINAINQTISSLDDEHKKFVKKHFWEDQPRKGIEDKRKRNKILTLICFYMRMPEYKEKYHVSFK